MYLKSEYAWKLENKMKNISGSSPSLDLLKNY